MSDKIDFNTNCKNRGHYIMYKGPIYQEDIIVSVVLGFEHRASCLLGRYSTAWAMPLV
jgi:hypothetical protein